MNINNITNEELCMLEQLTYLSEKVAKHILLKSSLRAAFFSLRLYNQIISALKNYFRKFFLRPHFFRMSSVNYKQKAKNGFYLPREKIY